MDNKNSLGIFVYEIFAIAFLWIERILICYFSFLHLVFDFNSEEDEFKPGSDFNVIFITQFVT